MCASFVGPFCYLCFTFVSFILSWLFLAALWWPGGKALLCVIFPCVFITLPFGVSGKMWYRIVSVPDLCNHNIKPLVILQTRGPNGDKMSSLRDTHTHTHTHARTHTYTHTICDLLGDAVDNAMSGCASRCSAIFSIVARWKSVSPVGIDMEISHLLLDVRSKTSYFQNVSYISGWNWPQTIEKGHSARPNFKTHMERTVIGLQWVVNS